MARFVKPETITLDSTDVSESLHSEWASGTSYVQGDRVYVTLESDGTTERTPHTIYEALQSTTGDYPPNNPTDWVYVSPTNRWAMLAPTSVAATVVTGGFTVTVSGSGDTLFLAGLQANTVDVVHKDSGGSVLDSETRNTLNEDRVRNAYEYHFAPIQFNRTAFFDRPSGAVTTEITINRDDESRLQHITIGDSTEIGTTLRGGRTELIDFSRKERNEFGVATLIPRRAVISLNLTAAIEQDTDVVTSQLANIRSTPVAWDGNNSGTDYGEFQTFGFIEDFESEALEAFDELPITIQGMI